MVSIYPKLNWLSSQTWPPCPVFYFWLNGTTVFRSPSLDPVTGQIPFINPSYFCCHPSSHSHLPLPSPRPSWVHFSGVPFPSTHSSCCLPASCRFLLKHYSDFHYFSPGEWFSLPHAPESPGGLATAAGSLPQSFWFSRSAEGRADLLSLEGPGVPQTFLCGPRLEDEPVLRRFQATPVCSFWLPACSLLSQCSVEPLWGCKDKTQVPLEKALCLIHLIPLCPFDSCRSSQWNAWGGQ